MKLTDKTNLDAVPVFDSLKSTLDEYIGDIYSYCIHFHNETKDFGFEVADSKEFFRYLVRMSSEPQYKVLRHITYFKKDGFSPTAVADLFSMIEDLKEWRSRLIQVTRQDLSIRAIAEAYHMDGLSTREITETLIKLGLLEEYNEENNPIDHHRKIRRWVKQFKNHDVIVKPKSH